MNKQWRKGSIIEGRNKPQPKMVSTIKRGCSPKGGLTLSLALADLKLLRMKFSSYDCTLAYSPINWNA